MAQAPVASLESGGGGELLQEPAAGLAGRPLEMHLGPGRAPRPARPPSQDRKSTRLNSSHLVISYAVFCLKKKKQTPFSNLMLRLLTLTRQAIHSITRLS